MSAEARPISSGQFAQAIEDLPVENLYAKAHEIQNSIHHLQRSNAQLQEYSDSIANDTTLDAQVRSEGDKDCLDAIRENKLVIDRQLERVALLKAEVERRGGRWHERDAKVNGVDGEVSSENPEDTSADDVSRSTVNPPSMSDEELRQRLAAQLDDDDNDNDDDHGNGLYL